MKLRYLLPQIRSPGFADFHPRKEKVPEKPETNEARITKQRSSEKTQVPCHCFWKALPFHTERAPAPAITDHHELNTEVTVSLFWGPRVRLSPTMLKPRRGCHRAGSFQRLQGIVCVPAPSGFQNRRHASPLRASPLRASNDSPASLTPHHCNADSQLPGPLKDPAVTPAWGAPGRPPSPRSAD